MHTRDLIVWTVPLASSIKEMKSVNSIIFYKIQITKQMRVLSFENRAWSVFKIVFFFYKNRGTFFSSENISAQMQNSNIHIPN